MFDILCFSALSQSLFLGALLGFLAGQLSRPAPLVLLRLLRSFLLSLVDLILDERVPRVLEGMGKPHLLVLTDLFQRISDGLGLPLFEEVPHGLPGPLRKILQELDLLPERARRKVSLELVSVLVSLDSLDFIVKLKDLYHCVLQFLLCVQDLENPLWILHAMSRAWGQEFTLLDTLMQPVFIVNGPYKVTLVHLLH